MALACSRNRLDWRAIVLGLAMAVTGGIATAQAQFGPQAVGLVNRLCAQTLRTNEEDRLYGMISLTVRATFRYRGAEFRPDMIDDAVQDSLDAMIEDCPELTDADENKRLNMAVEMISDATSKVIEDARKAELTGEPGPYPKRALDKLTAADLSEELSSQEIDQWLNAMTPRQRAVSLFLYASDVTPQEIAAAVGEPPGGITRQAAASKNDLMRLFHEEYQEPLSAPRGGPAIQYRMSGPGLATLMQPGVSAAPAVPQPAAAATDAAATDPPSAPAPPPRATPTMDGYMPALRVTGISDDIYAGWSLIATGRNLPRGQAVTIPQPIVLEPDTAGMRRMLVTDIAEIGNPNAETRHFLLKAYAIDADKESGGLRDTFHVGAPLANEEAKKTLANPNLASIEVARCLWLDYGTGPDPGLCR